MSVVLHRIDGISARERVIRDVIRELAAVCPEEMLEAARVLREQTAAQYDRKTGKWQNETAAGGHFKVSFPRLLMEVLRPIMRKLLPDEPPFAHDDADLLFVMREFPDLIGGKHLSAPRRKDYRKRTLLKGTS